MQNEALKQFWKDWKNVIIVTILVIINITSLTWAPIIASWFKSDPAEIESLAKYIQDTMWLIVFIYAAQIIFSNRKARMQAKKKKEEAEAQALLAAGEGEAPDQVPGGSAAAEIEEQEADMVASSAPEEEEERPGSI